MRSPVGYDSCYRGRYSGRSRTSSFRRSGRTSQRSADSALGLSECRSSYSDTDCRYIDDGDLMLGRGIQANRASQHSRFSDTVLQVSSAVTPALEQPNGTVSYITHLISLSKFNLPLIGSFYVTHAARVLQSHELSGEGIKLWITDILF